MASGDINCNIHGHGSFTLRVGYLIMNDMGQVLTQRLTLNGESMYILPGGKASYGATTSHSLIREVMEETGVAITEGDISLAVVAERLFRKCNGKYGHEQMMLYRVNLPDGAVMPKRQLDGARFHFKWLQMQSLQNYNFREAYIFEQIKDFSQGVQQAVFNELDEPNFLKAA